MPGTNHRRRTARALLVLAHALLITSACGGGLESETLPDLLNEAVELELPGIVIVARTGDGSLNFAGAAGWADVQGRVAMEPDTGFRIASNSKTFVGLALASLAQEGLVDLDVPMGQILPGDATRDIANAPEATLRQALQHTSGIMDYLDNDAFWRQVDEGRSQPWTMLETLEFARGERAYFSVGDGWGYSNTNYILAGLAIEVVTGESWGSVLRQRVMDPIGMNQSFVENEEPARIDIAHGYVEGVEDVFNLDTGYGLPDGGVVATAPELAAFIRAVGGGPIPAGLSAPAVSALLADAVSSEDGERYGLGLAQFPTACGRTIGHGGALDGYLSEMYYVPERDLTLVVFVNADEGWVDDLFFEVVDRALEIVCDAE